VSETLSPGEVLSPTSTRGAAKTAARLLGALGAALAAACSDGGDAATGEGVVLYGPPLGPEAGLTISLTPGAASVEHVDDAERLLGEDGEAPDRVLLRVPATLTLTSYGLSAGGADDPFLDEAAEASACLALLLREPRTLTVGPTSARVEAAVPGRSGFAQDREGQDRFTATWSTAVSWTVAADRLPELAAPEPNPLDSLGPGDPFVVEAATAL